MKANPTSLRTVLLCVPALMLGACASRVVERQVVHEQPIVQQAPAQPAERVVIMPPPATPQEQIPPAPSATGYAWVAGHYVWHNGWNWEPGHWVQGSARPMPSPYSEAPTQPPAPDARWVPGYWDYVGHDWEWNKGHWESR
jgi:hypothetical protein